MQRRHKFANAVAAIILENYQLEHRGEENYFGAVPISLAVEKRYRELAADVITSFPEYGERFAPEDIEERLCSLIVNTVRSGDIERVSGLMDEFWTRLDNPDERKVCFVPLQGISMAESSVQIGEFNLRLMDPDGLRYATDLWSAAIDRTTSSERIKADSKSLFGREFSEHLRNTVCVQVQVCADKHKADGLALKNALTLLDLIRFTIPSLYPKSRNIAVGLKGEGGPGIYRRYILPLGESDGTVPTYRTGPFGDFEMDQKALAAMKRLGVVKFAEGFGRPQTALQNSIGNAIHWFAESQVQKTSNYELLSLIIAVETLFASEIRKKAMTDTLCEAVAVLLTDTASEQEDMFNFLRDAFRWRGDVAHAGRDASGYTDLGTLRMLVQHLISASIHQTDSFVTPEAMLLWVKGQKPGMVDKLHPKRSSQKRPR